LEARGSNVVEADQGDISADHESSVLHRRSNTEGRHVVVRDNPEWQRRAAK
jgi:hypothetical protein